MFTRLNIPARRFLSSRPTGNITKNLNDRRKASEEKYFREQERDLLKKLNQSVQEGLQKGKDTVSQLLNSSQKPK